MWGTSSEWRGTLGEEIRITCPQLLNIRSLLSFLSTPSLGDCRALTFFRGPSESAAPAGLPKSLKHPPAQRLPGHMLASSC